MNTNLNARNIEDILALSPMQEGMFFDCIKSPKGKDNIVQLSLNIAGKIDIDVFKKAWEFVFESNEMLRTVFAWENIEKPIQLVLRKQDVVITENEEQEINLNVGPVLKLYLNEYNQGSYKLIITNHHIIADGWSMSIILQEFFKAYSQLRDGNLPAKLNKTKYKDYLKCLQNRDKAGTKIFWTEYLKEYEPKHLAPTSKIKKKDLGSIERLSFQLSSQMTINLEELTSTLKITHSTIFHAVWALLLQKYNNTDDIIFGTVVSGRTANIPKIEEMVGLFINTLPLRVRRTKDITVTDLLDVIHTELRQIQTYENTPLVEIKACCEMNTTEKLFDTIIAIENYPLSSVLKKSCADLQIRDFSITEMPTFDLSVEITAFEQVEITFLYNPALFTPNSIETIANYFLNILNQIIINPQSNISTIEIISPEEKAKLYNEFNNTSYPVPPKTIDQLFEEQVQKTPDKIALIFKEHKLSYNMLDYRASLLASFLRKKNITKDVIIPIIAEPSLEMIIGILAILKSGGAYLPIDPKSPINRIEFMLRDSNAKILLTNTHLSEKVAFQGDIIDLNKPEFLQGDLVTISKEHDTNSLAYVIYTSGSTGIPKGVLIEHHSLVNLCTWHNTYFNVTAKDQSTKYAGFGFDASVWEIFPYIVKGATIHIISDDIKLDIYALNEYFETNHISISFLPTQLCEQFLELENKSLRLLLTGGDQLRNYKKTNYQLYNNYGPTENTVVTTTFLVDSTYDNIPIGKPIYNTQIIIVDQDNNLQPIGVTGELCITGCGLARGYLNRPELTTEKFSTYDLDFSNGITTKNRMYKTGDLGRWLPDGNIEFVGRKDHQVKIRGFRIELGEIENQLMNHQGIDEAVVVPKTDNSGNKYLCAYYLSQNEIAYSILKEFLLDKLPDYMIPFQLIRLEQFPLNQNGKIDRKVLAEDNSTPERIRKVEYIPPQNSIEEKLVIIWSELLQNSKIGVEDNFFELGGHSISASLLSLKVKKEFKVELPIRIIFKNPTIKEIAKYIKNVEKISLLAIGKLENREYYTLSSAQKRLFAIHHIMNNDISYNLPSFMLIEGDLDIIRFENAFKMLIKRHESLRTEFDYFNGEVGQKICENVDFKIQYFLKSENEDKIIADFIRPFDLSKAPLLRVGLIKLDKAHLLMFDMHHIISDGFSIEIMKKEIGELYQGHDLPALRLQYRDYAAWQNNLLDSDLLKIQEKYWLKVFSEKTPSFDLPFDFDRLRYKNNQGKSLKFSLDQSLREEVSNLTRHKNLTFFMTLLGIYNILLSKYSGAEDIVVGTPILGRSHPDFEKMIGMFVNTIALRNYPKKGQTFSSFLTEIKENVLEAFENQDYPFEQLVEKLNLTRSVGVNRNPLFDTFFTWQKENNANFIIDNLKFTPHAVEKRVTKFDLIMTVIDDETNLYFELEYNEGLFKEETIKRLGENYIFIIAQVCKNPEIKLSEIEILLDRTKTNEQLIYMSDKNLYKDVTVENKPEFILPANNITKQIAEIWSDVLHVDIIGVRDNFFELGGNSLKLIQVNARIFQEMNVRIPASDFYERPTIAELADYIVHLEKEKFISIVTVEDREYYPLSSPQRRLFVLNQIDNDTISYNMPCFMILEGELDKQRFSEVLQKLMQRHESLRTSFMLNAGEPVQKIYQTIDFNITYKEILSDTIHSAIDQFVRSFDLSKPPLFRVELDKFENGYLFMFDMHHIISDGYSMDIFVREFVDLYEGRELSEVKVRYRDYAVWQNDFIKTELFKKQEKYWLEQLKGLLYTKIPFSQFFASPEKSADYIDLVFAQDLTERIESYCRQNNLSKFVFLLTLFKIIIYLETKQNDLSIGTPLLGRTRTELENMIGLFLNVVVIRSKIELLMSFIDYLELVNKTFLEAQENQDYHYDELYARFKEQYDYQHDSLFSIMFNYIPFKSEEHLKLSKLKISPYQLERIEAKYPISLYVSDKEDSLQFKLVYQNELYDRYIMERILNDLERMACLVLENDRILVSEIDLGDTEISDGFIADFDELFEEFV